MFPELLFNHFFLSKLGGITNDPHGSRTEENGPDRLGYTAVIAPRFEFSSEGTLLSLGSEFPHRLCDPLPQYDFIMSAVTPLTDCEQ